MSSRETSITHSALGWVKKSIDDNLSEIETDLKHYIEDRDEALLEGVKQTQAEVAPELKHLSSLVSDSVKKKA